MIRAGVAIAAVAAMALMAGEAKAQKDFCKAKPRVPIMRHGVIYGRVGVSCSVKANIQVYSCLVFTDDIFGQKGPQFRACEGERVWGDWVALVESRWACKPQIAMKSFWHMVWYLFATAPGKPKPVSYAAKTPTAIFRCDP